MSIKNKIGAIACVAIMAVIIISAVSYWVVNSLINDGQRIITAFNEVAGTIPKLQGSTESASLMLNADRDAFQAYVARLKVNYASDPEIIAFSDKDNLENIEQVEDRVSRASVNFDQEMLKIYAGFESYFPEWKELSRESIDLSRSNKELRDKQEKLEKTARNNFGLMRGELDKLTEEFENKIKTDPAEVQELFKAMSLVLNADRDAYQAQYAQLKGTAALTQDELSGYNKDNLENIEQVSERVNKASSSFDQKMSGLNENFGKYYSAWRSSSREILDISNKILQNNDTLKKLDKKTMEKFSLTREVLDVLGSNTVEMSQSYVASTKEKSKEVMAIVEEARNNMTGSIKIGVIIIAVIIESVN